MKPIILIDFDGVFNILGELSKAHEYWDEILTVTIPYDGHDTEKEFVVHVATELIAYLKALVESDLVEVIWLTTWVQNTEKFPQWLGLPALPWMARPEVASEWDWWKQKAVKALVEERGSDVPILWIDDDHGFDPSTTHWVFTTQRQIQLLPPSSYLAITPSDITTINNFIYRHTGRSLSDTETE